MGHQEHEQIYLSLSRKELQGLCKQHGLPANRSNLDLARSLESLFRRTNLSQLPSEEAFDVLPFPEPKPKDQTKSSGETDKGFGREYVTRKNSSKAGAYRRIACLKESVGQEKRDSQTANQVENESQVNGQTSDKALSRVANILSICPATNGAAEDAGCSNSGPGTSIQQHLFMTDVQDIAACSQIVSQSREICSKSRISELKNNRHSWQSSVATICGVCSLPVVPYTFQKFGECLPGSGFLSPNAVTSTIPPAFQFFVESEDGINFFVDLCSTPSDWVKSLKDEVCISQESYNGKPLALCHEIRYLGDANKKLKAPPTDIVERNSLPIGSGGSTGCTNSSLSSFSEFCNSVHIPTNNDTPRSSVLTSNGLPVELSGHLDEVSQVVSSSCTACASMKNHMVSDALSGPGDVKTLPPNCAGDSFMLEKINTSSHNGCLSKSSCNSQDNLEAHGLQQFDQLEHPTLEAGSDCSQNVGLLGHMSESASEKSSFSLSSERCVVSRSFDTCNHENQSRCCQISPATSSKDVKLLKVTDNDKDKSTAYQVPAQEILACSSMELDERESNYHILDQRAHAKPGYSTPEVPASTSNNELETCISLKEKLNSERAPSTKSLVKSCKRSHISEQHEEFQNKRQQSNGENQVGAAMNLRNMKAHLKESNCDALVVPRRSIRLMSK